ncbi:hypothetical protein L6452_01218 [Arctium lappa]|uniref:Uncharacterized protein n=1 Tax=Arctium lappa TaxID=4217 RepID=A0ACB9FHI4_ARCLA|nr:hypothetical protein L6452_01218 [Arctium lappa]
MISALIISMSVVSHQNPADKFRLSVAIMRHEFFCMPVCQMISIPMESCEWISDVNATCIYPLIPVVTRLTNVTMGFCSIGTLDICTVIKR